MNITVNDINYKIKSASEDEIFIHLSECSDTFIPPLAERVNIKDYSTKIYGKSITFEGWARDLLVGLIAAYFHDNTDRSAFITSVSVLRKFGGLGISSKLLDMCIEYATRNNFRELNLEVDQLNNPAILLYKKFNFHVYETKGKILLMNRQIV